MREKELINRKDPEVSDLVELKPEKVHRIRVEDLVSSESYLLLGEFEDTRHSTWQGRLRMALALGQAGSCSGRGGR